MSASAAAAQQWTLLRAGAGKSDAMNAVGEPLFRHAGRRFEVWIFDCGGEVVFVDGRVWAWSVPAQPTHTARALPGKERAPKPTRIVAEKA